MFAQEAQGNQMGAALLCHPFVAQLFHFRIEKGRKFAQVVEVVLHGGKKGGIEFLEQGLYLVADFVAYKQGFAVGGVFSPGECAFFTEVANLIGRSKKQGSDKLLAPVIHAGQSPYPGTATQIQEEGLDGVVAVVAGGQKNAVVLGHKLLKPTVAQFAGGHFDGKLMRARISGGVEALHMDFYSFFTTKIPDKGFVGIRLAAAQIEITMGGYGGVTGCLQKMQQSHRIGPSTESHQNAQLFIDPTAPKEVVTKAFFEVVGHGLGTHLLGAEVDDCGSMAAALSRHSWHCCSGSESAVVAVPAVYDSRRLWGSQSKVRITMLKSKSFSGLRYPMAPEYKPLFRCT